ncbi:MAG: M23 family metallopeptidase [Candidatus Omnitrophota bacterium]
MKKLILILFILLSVYIPVKIYSLDKNYFLCPVEYHGNLLVRCDSRGNGFFASPRKGRRLHNGVDLLAEVGAPVFSPRSGRVIKAAQNKGMGKYIIIRHSDNMVTIYGHLSQIYVSRNKFVRQGELIARVGKTGNAKAPSIQPHLHFEIRKSGIPQDPLEYL